jgi:hypothetical protein
MSSEIVGPVSIFIIVRIAPTIAIYMCIAIFCKIIAKLYNDKQSNGKFQNHSRGNVSHNDRSNDFSVDSNAHVYSNRWGNSNNNKDRYRFHNLNRHEKQTL